MFFKMNVLRILQILAIAPAFLASNDLYTFNEDVGNRLKEYLKELSSPKPIKCEVKIPKTRNEWIPSTPWFRSRRCIKDEKWTGYQFTGKYDTLDRFHGPGKFKLGSDGITPDKNFHSTCIEFPTKFDSGAYIESIVGTFVNGTLQGNAKITFNGKTGFVISSFHEGVPHGLKRSFSHSKELIGAEIVSMNSPVGYYWKSIVDGTSYLLDFIHTNETAHQMDAYQSLVFNSSTNTFIGGTFPRYLDFLYDPYSPKGLTFKDDTQDCIKYLLWEKTYPAPEEVYSLIKHSLISALPSEKELSPESEAPAPSRLIRFRKSVLDNEALWTIKLRNTLKPVDKDAKILFLTDITRTAGNNINLYTCLLCGERVNMTHREGLLDSEGRFHGPTWISIMSENQTRDKIFNTTISNIWTQFDHGTLQDGLLKIQYKDIRNVYVHIISNTLHGPMIIHELFQSFRLSTLTDAMYLKWPQQYSYTKTERSTVLFGLPCWVLEH
uniref:Uncharacterized protein n=1 Tax=Lepeophtheirus salmonis TaxID=72036 RepID=A0A0K2UYC2_LEPSM